MKLRTAVVAGLFAVGVIAACAPSRDLRTRTAEEIRGPAGVLHVNDGGAGGLPVVFVHSFAGDHLHWAAQIDHLRAQRRVIAFDLRGHGRSASPASGAQSVDALADDIQAVIDGLQIDRFVLVGHSMGGAASLAYAGRHPLRVAGLMLVGTPGKTPPEQAAPIIASLESDAYEQVMEILEPTPDRRQTQRSHASRSGSPADDARSIDRADQGDVCV